MVQAAMRTITIARATEYLINVILIMIDILYNSYSPWS